jgi:hypothetical protein
VFWDAQVGYTITTQGEPGWPAGHDSLTTQTTYFRCDGPTPAPTPRTLPATACFQTPLNDTQVNYFANDDQTVYSTLVDAQWGCLAAGPNCSGVTSELGGGWTTRAGLHPIPSPGQTTIFKCASRFRECWLLYTAAGSYTQYAAGYTTLEAAQTDCIANANCQSITYTNGSFSLRTVNLPGYGSSNELAFYRCANNTPVKPPSSGVTPPSCWLAFPAFFSNGAKPVNTYAFSTLANAQANCTASKPSVCLAVTYTPNSGYFVRSGVPQPSLNHETTYFRCDAAPSCWVKYPGSYAQGTVLSIQYPFPTLHHAMVLCAALGIGTCHSVTASQGQYWVRTEQAPGQEADYGPNYLVDAAYFRCETEYSLLQVAEGPRKRHDSRHLIPL